MSETVDLRIRRTERWQHSMWLLDGNQPVDLTGVLVELVITPIFGFGVPIETLTTMPGEGIVKDNAGKGAISIDYDAASLPAGAWTYFLRTVNGADIVEYRRGGITILEGA